MGATCSTGTMDIQEILRNLAESVTTQVSVKTVFGDPVSAGERTVIPAARVRYRFGAGGGRQEGGEGHGGGGGAWISATPCGMIEVAQDGARYIGFDGGRKLGIALLLGFLAGAAVVGLRGPRRVEIVKRQE